MLYILNLYSAIWQLYLSKTGRKIQKRKYMEKFNLLKKFYELNFFRNLYGSNN